MRPLTAVVVIVVALLLGSLYIESSRSYRACVETLVGMGNAPEAAAEACQ